jgi:hypothetical protein
MLTLPLPPSPYPSPLPPPLAATFLLGAGLAFIMPATFSLVSITKQRAAAAASGGVSSLMFLSAGLFVLVRGAFWGRGDPACWRWRRPQRARQLADAQASGSCSRPPPARAGPSCALTPR